jgi:hypothetical protein
VLNITESRVSQIHPAIVRLEQAAAGAAAGRQRLRTDREGTPAGTRRVQTWNR